jgi:stage V sporulation protein B
MGKDKFFKNSLILTTANLTTGILGFIFSIILSKELGPEGMGLYGLVMPIYNLFICLICGGIITAISKLSAEYMGKRDFNNLKRMIKTTLSFNVFFSLIIVSLVFIFSSHISTYIIKDTRTLYALRLTVPAMLFIALSNTIKGYFYGTSNMSVPAFIDISEKAIRIGVIFALVNLFKFSSITGTVTAAYVALCVGEFISLIMLYIYYKLDIRKLPYSTHRSEGRAQLMFNVFKMSLPLCFNGLVSSVLATVSTLIIPRRLVSAGIEYSNALSMIGKFTSMSLNIVFFPIIIIGSISTVLIPDLSENISKKDYYTAERRISQVFKISFLLGLGTLIICLTIPEKLGMMFYNREDLGNYIRFAALSAPIFYVSATTYGILNGLGKQNIILRNSLILSTLELVLLYILTAIPSINIYGYGITLITTSTLTLALNYSEIKKHIDIFISPFNIVLDILIAIFVYFLMSTLVKLLPDDLNTLKNILVIAFSFGLTFIINMFFTKKSETA